MRKIIVLAVAAVVVAAAGYLFLFKKKELGSMVDSASGYPEATTAKECVDLFRKAIKERSYKMAAKYVTTPYGDELRKGADAGYELGKEIDDLVSRMKNDGVMTDEMRLVIFYYDPFYPDINPTLSNEQNESAMAQIRFEGLSMPNTQTRAFENWQLDGRAQRGLSVNMPLPGGGINVPMKKENNVWKLDFKVTPAQQLATTFLNDHYKDYVNPFRILSGEIKRDPTTKENVKTRMKELLEEAARN